MKQMIHTPEGVRDIYGVECRKTFILRDNLHKVFMKYGYRDIETPTFEYFDVFGKEVGTISSRELYKFFDRDGNTLVLRPDITPSIARASAALYGDEPMPVRLCYSGKTFINHTSYQGRLKETTQLGAELIGDDSVMADAEMIALIIDALKEAGLTEFQVSVGQVNYFKSLIEEAGMDEETEQQLKTLITNKNHFGVEELLSHEQISDEQKQVFLKMPELFGGVQVLKEAEALTSNQKAKEAIHRLQQIHEVLAEYGLTEYVSFDLGMVGNYMYYTGAIFRAYTYGTGDAIVKGGRYDNLLSSFGKEASAVGFVIVLDEVMGALARQKIEVPYEKSNTLLLYPQQHRNLAIGLAGSYRSQGMNVEMLEKREEVPLEDYKDFGRRHHLGGILYIEKPEAVRVINLEQDTEQTADISVFLQNSEEK